MNYKPFIGSFIGIILLVALLYMFSMFGAYTIVFADPVMSVVWFFVIGAIVTVANKVM